MGKNNVIVPDMKTFCVTDFKICSFLLHVESMLLALHRHRKKELPTLLANVTEFLLQ